MNMVRIGVIGAGANGIACAVKVKEKYKDFDVVLLSSDFSPNTTGDGSGGLWYPYLVGKTPESLINKWGGETYEFLHQLWLEGGHDISLMPIYTLYRRERDPFWPDWAKSVFGYKILSKMQLKYLSELHHGVPYSSGETFTTFIAPPPKIIEYLYKRFREVGGKVVKAHVTSLEDPILNQFQVIINCPGLGAKEIVPDANMVPIRGQISRVLATWMNETVMDEDTGHYVIPNAENCVLGGTHQEHNVNTSVDPADTDFIFDGCNKIVPGLQHAKVVRHWVGLRPGRNEIRLEPEEKNGKLIIHNYGHGGSGLTLFWGCATDVLKLLDLHLETNTKFIKMSKL